MYFIKGLDRATATLCTDVEAGYEEGIQEVPQQQPIKAYMAVRHLPDTQGQFSQ